MFFRRLSIATVIFTYFLIVVGGVVRVTGSGLGCPDWPLCHGSIIPPLEVPTLIEYSHRLTASVVSVLVVLTALVAIARYRDRPWVIIPSLAAVFLLIVQIALGAITVELELPPTIITAHLGTALLLFASVTVAAVGARVDARSRPVPRGLASLGLLVAIGTYVVLLVGSQVTVTAATLACPSWPFCGGATLDPGTAGGRLNLLHRALVLLVFLGYVYLMLRVRRLGRDYRSLNGHVMGGITLFCLQVLVGALIVLIQPTPFIRGLHLAVGAAFWGSMVALVAILFIRRARLDQHEPTAGGPPGEPIGAQRGAQPARPGDSVRAYFMLMKPGIIVLLLITTLFAMLIAARGIPPTGLVLVTMLGGALAAGGAGAINSFVDRDIDPLMRRTRRRPLATGRVAPRRALVFGIALGALSFALFAFFVNIVSALLAMAGLLFYTVVYTMYLKRSTVQNIVVGGAAGAFPPLVGWAAVTGDVQLPALFLFAVIFFWTPPHFWALSLVTQSDYRQAGIPMLPIVYGEEETRRQIVLYTIQLIAITLLFFATRAVGVVYLISAVVLGCGMLYLALQLLRDKSARRARLLFRYSNIYLALLFAATAIDRILPNLSA